MCFKWCANVVKFDCMTKSLKYTIEIVSITIHNFSFYTFFYTFWVKMSLFKIASL